MNVLDSVSDIIAIVFMFVVAPLHAGCVTLERPIDSLVVTSYILNPRHPVLLLAKDTCACIIHTPGDSVILVKFAAGTVTHDVPVATEYDPDCLVVRYPISLSCPPAVMLPAALTLPLR